MHNDTYAISSVVLLLVSINAGSSSKVDNSQKALRWKISDDDLQSSFSHNSLHQDSLCSKLNTCLGAAVNLK